MSSLTSMKKRREARARALYKCLKCLDDGLKIDEYHQGTPVYGYCDCRAGKTAREQKRLGY